MCNPIYPLEPEQLRLKTLRTEGEHVAARVIDTFYSALDIKALRFQLDRKLDLEAGSHVIFAVPNEPFTLSRTYSVVEYDPHAQVLTIAVKLEPQSRGGSAYMWCLLPGDEVPITSNGNSLPLSYGAMRYVLITGGIGVTSLLGIVRSLVASGKQVDMHYAAKAHSQAAFLCELHNLLGENLQFYAGDLQERLSIDAIIDSVDEGTLVYVCGPLRMLDAVRKYWVQSGLPPENLRYEAFTDSEESASPYPSAIVSDETIGSLRGPPQRVTLNPLSMKGATWGHKS
ncbi:hypothetical protein BGP82_17075 [Pseudomonas putida]|uniref:FAD-binding FR-type domain-containing protein n=1 Tax=Pseudomonas putida TaxID=303 RepID=A0A1L5PTF9_PSEPU|nr:hypothetical protein BL240_18725 [Pseudomonas putida]POG03010.1 hypothetical protein BGP82_17075 [Pseudomonas putida]